MLGTRISHYVLIDRLGEGGMGIVYEALDETLGRRVALKFPSRDLPSSGQLFAEARAASRLNHPNVAHIYEFGETEQGAFIAMELVRGRTLSQILAGGPLAPEEGLRIVRAVSEALAEAHRQGIMHLDIKPGNIALNDRGVVKVLDFGLARSLPTLQLEPGDDPTQTLTRELRGTPTYMSPEQARGLPLDESSDLFSLGAVLYECLTGHRAFPAETAVRTLLEVVSRDPPAPSTIVPGIPQRLDRIVLKLLAKDPQSRYRSATELLADLARLEEDPVPVGPRKAGVNRVARIGAAVVLLVVVLAAVWLVYMKRPRASSGKRQVAVLPFEDLNRQPEQAAFCDGLAEVVAGILSKPGVFSRELWVLPSNDVRRFGVLTVADSGRTLHADIAIGGSVRRESSGSQQGWLITITASDATPPHLLGSRNIRVADSNAADLEPKLTAALVELLNLGAAPAVAAAAPAVPPPSDIYSRFVAARGYLRQYDHGDNLKHAVSELEAVTQAAPAYAPAQVALSEAYYRQYNSTKNTEWLAKADQAVRRAADIDGNEPGIHLMLGRILSATGQTDLAIRELQTVLARDPGDVSALLTLAGAYISAKRLPEAEATYQQATRIRPSYFPAYMNLGALYMSQAKWRQAEELLTLVTKLAPDYADGFTTLGSIVYYQDRLDDAERLFTRSIELKPTAAAYANRCGIEFEKKAMDRAVADCRKAVDLQPTNPIAWGNLADALYQRGSQADALEAWKRALETGNRQLAINPTNPDLIAVMAKIAAKTGQKGLAIELAKKALGQGTAVRVLYNAAKAYGLSGECARSAELLKQAFDDGYPRQDARRDPDLLRLRAAPLTCTIPPI